MRERECVCVCVFWLWHMSTIWCMIIMILMHSRRFDCLDAWEVGESIDDRSSMMYSAMQKKHKYHGVTFSVFDNTWFIRGLNLPRVSFQFTTVTSWSLVKYPAETATDGSSCEVNLVQAPVCCSLQKCVFSLRRCWQRSRTQHGHADRYVQVGRIGPRRSGPVFSCERFQRPAQQHRNLR